MTKDKKFNIEDEGEEQFGMADVNEPKKYTPNKVTEVEGVNNAVTIE